MRGEVEVLNDVDNEFSFVEKPLKRPDCPLAEVGVVALNEGFIHTFTPLH